MPSSKLKRFQKEYGLSVYDAQILTKDRQTADFFEEATKAAKEVGITPKQVANVIINKKPDTSKTQPATLVKDMAAAGKPLKVSHRDLENTIKTVIAQNQKAVDDYKRGKTSALEFLIGQVMRKISAPPDVNRVKLMLEEKLK